jgi:flagellar hook-associated protein 1
MSDFSAIGTALSGMNAAREELDVTGNNIANQNTVGYVRESTDLAAAGAAAPTMQMPSTGVGQGVLVLGVTRYTDTYLDAQDLVATGNAGGLSQTQSVLSQAQDAFGEPSSTGISEQLASFWSEWDTVANMPTDVSARATLLAKATGLATSFNQTAGELAQVKAGATSQALDVVDQINRDAGAIAALNDQIINAKAGGSDAAGLADQRDALVTKLADLAGVTTRTDASGAVDVLIGAQRLVDGVNANTVSASVTGGTLSLTWSMSNTPVAAAGRLGALVNAVNVTLPGYQQQLDSAADALASAVNDHLTGNPATGTVGGVTWTGVGTAGQTWTYPGTALFTGSGAAGLSVNPAMTTDQLAVGAVPTDGTAPSVPPPAGSYLDPTGPSADGSNAQLIANLGSSTGGPDSIYRALVGRMGTDVSTATTQANAATTVRTNADAARQSSEGVNLDEELANMTQFQNAYSANAKFLSAVDQTVRDLLAMVG